MIREYTSDCVHCGFCLPTSQRTCCGREEMDRRAGASTSWTRASTGRSRSTRPLPEHFDRCLGCMACLSSCPRASATTGSSSRHARRSSGSRPIVRRSFRARTALSAAAVPGTNAVLRLAPLGRLAPMPSRLRPLAEIAPRWRGEGDVPTVTPAEGPRRARVGLLTGCVQSAVFPDVNAATTRVSRATASRSWRRPRAAAARLGARRPPRGGQGFARRLIESFREVELVVVNTSGCGSHLKELGWLLGDEGAEEFSAKVRDVGELLADTASGIPAPAADEGRAPGLVPSTGTRRGCRSRSLPRFAASRPRRRRARGAGHLLRLGRIYNVVQAQAARESSATARRSTYSRRARRRTRARTPAVSSRSRSAAAREEAACRRSTRSSFVDASIRRVPAGRLQATARARRHVLDVDDEIADEGEQPDDHGCPAEPCTGGTRSSRRDRERCRPRRARAGADQKTATLRNPSTDRTTAVTPPTPCRRARGTIHPNTRPSRPR